MGRAIREIKSELVLLRQKGDFFSNEAESELYKQCLNAAAARNESDILGYLLSNSLVTLFLRTKNLPKFMQSLNSSFVRARNRLRQPQQKGEIKRYEARDVGLDEYDDVLAYIGSNGGYTQAVVQKNLSLGQKIDIQKFKKRTQMRLQALNPTLHKELCYHSDMVPDFAYAQIVASECVACERDFAIVFSNDAQPRLLVLFGKDSNILIDKNFKGYVPASVKNYPFSLAQVQGENVLCIDEEAPQLMGVGERLFKDDESPSEFLSHIISAMQNYNAQLEKTNVALAEIKKAGILVNKELSINLDDKKITLIKGFSVVSRKKLNELDDAVLANFARRGYLELINSHLRSLENLENLAARILENESK